MIGLNIKACKFVKWHLLNNHTGNLKQADELRFINGYNLYFLW